MSRFRYVFVSIVLLAVLGASSGSYADVAVMDLGGDQYRVKLSVAPGGGANAVYVAGTFNGWNPTAQAMTGPDADGVFRTMIVLPKGRYEYKFVVDGRRWMSDASNPHRTGGYGNSILFVGMEPDDQASTADAGEPVVMAGEVDHPKQVQHLVAQLQDVDAAERSKLVARWLHEHPMPLFTDQAISFVYAGADARAINLLIAAHGARTGYLVHRIGAGGNVFAISLRRADVPERAAYTYQVTKADTSRSVVDPHAWSLTSRSGEPAGRIVEASEKIGRLEVIRQLAASSGAVQPRDVYVYLPPGYDASDDKRYPVLYMHDGQNCWDDPVEPFGHGGWCVNLAADRLIDAGAIVPFIGVGVANTPDRLQEYGPGPDIFSADRQPYIRYLVDDVKAEVDRRYRTLTDAAHTALMGSSMGGVISLQAAIVRPDVFGQAACLSSAFIFGDASGHSYFDLIKKLGKQPVRLYLDSGTAGRQQDGAPKTRAMVALLRETGWKEGVDLMHFEDTGAEHNERAWRARVDRPLWFLFGKQPSNKPKSGS